MTPAAMAQDDPAVVADATTKTAGGGGAQAEAECKDGVIESVAGGVVDKAPCETPPPKAAPAPAPAPAPAAPLPASGGMSLLALGAGVLLVAGDLLARRIVK
jgi:hypothetical protein